MANDKILHVYGPDYDGQYHNDGDTTFGYKVDPGIKPDWQDTIKYSNGIAGFLHYVGNVFGGQEDCVDINNKARNLRIDGTFFPQGKYAFTIKGGASNIDISGNIVGHGSEVDVDLGNWSDQSQEKTTNVTLDLKMMDGSPVVVRVLNADRPHLRGGNYVYAFPSPDAWYHGICVWWFKTFRRFFK